MWRLVGGYPLIKEQPTNCQRFREKIPIVTEINSLISRYLSFPRNRKQAFFLTRMRIWRKWGKLKMMNRNWSSIIRNWLWLNGWELFKNHPCHSLLKTGQRSRRNQRKETTQKAYAVFALRTSKFKAKSFFHVVTFFTKSVCLLLKGTIKHIVVQFVENRTMRRNSSMKH